MGIAVPPYCDDNYNAEGIASLFTEDGVWDGEPRGVNNGREAIRQFFSRGHQRVPFAVQAITKESNTNI